MIRRLPKSSGQFDEREYEQGAANLAAPSSWSVDILTGGAPCKNLQGTSAATFAAGSSRNRPADLRARLLPGPYPVLLTGIIRKIRDFSQKSQQMSLWATWTRQPAHLTCSASPDENRMSPEPALQFRKAWMAGAVLC